MLTLDAHCDVLWKMNDSNYTFDNENMHINLKKIHKVAPHIQIFACFIEPYKVTRNSLVDILRNIDAFNSIITKYNNIIEAAYSFDDIIKITSQNKCAGLLWLEGGDAINGQIEILRILYKLGIRGITLTWNNSNEIACGIEEKTDRGLSPFGKELVKEMNSLGMIVDVSHLGELGFWQVMNLTTKPVVATHSNARSICKHKRNLTDEQIKEIANKNGVVGINFHPAFLVDDGIATIDDILTHIEYICELVGANHLCFGSDFDGIDTVPRGAEDITHLENILNELAKRNYTSDQIENIASKNFLRVIRECL